MLSPTEKEVVQQAPDGVRSSVGLRKIARRVAACVEENRDRPDRTVASLSNYQFKAIPHFGKPSYSSVLVGCGFKDVRAR